MIRLVRRPAFPGETNYELVWSLAFIGFSFFAFIFFQLGGTSPGCLFYRLTSIPCLGCGATRCARAWIHGDFWAAFKYHPGFFVILILGFIWTLYSLFTWMSGSVLRLRFVTSESGRKLFFPSLFVIALVHWIWQCYYLR